MTRKTAVFKSSKGWQFTNPQGEVEVFDTMQECMEAAYAYENGEADDLGEALTSL